MICCQLLFTKEFKKASDAINYYNLRRTLDLKGVNIRSQLRYVHYFGTMLENGKIGQDIQNQYFLQKKIVVSGAIVKKFDENSLYINVLLGAREREQVIDTYELKNESNATMTKNIRGDYEFLFDNDICLYQDIKIEIRNYYKPQKGKLGSGWINLNFVDDTGVIRQLKDDMDKLCKDVKNEKVSESYFFEAHFVNYGDGKVKNQKESKQKFIELLDIAKKISDDVPIKYYENFGIA